jgi:hypothetical protein
LNQDGKDTAKKKSILNALILKRVEWFECSDVGQPNPFPDFLHF